MILNDQQIVREFVKFRRASFASKALTKRARSVLGSSYGFEDMAFVVSKTDEVLTPEEQSLLLINANVISSNTGPDVAGFPQLISVESLSESASKAVEQCSGQFSEIWDNLTAMATSLRAVNSVTAFNISSTKIPSANPAVSAMKSSEQSDSFLVLSSLRSELVLSQYGVNYIDSLNEKCADYKARIKETVLPSIAAARELLCSGMAEFSKSSLRSTETEITRHQTSAGLAFVGESIHQSPDGLIATLVVDGVDQTNTAVFAPIEFAQSARLAPAVAINCDTLNGIKNQLNTNLELVTYCIQVCNSLLDAKLNASITAFDQAIENTFSKEVVSQRVKDAAKAYCDMFINASNMLNAELSNVLEITKFVISFNELLASVVKHTVHHQSN